MQLCVPTLFQGFNVVGLHMRNWDEGDENGVEECPAKKDWQDVLKVCQQLQIECKRVTFVKEYWNDVFSPFLEGYSAGITPNPDIMCNREIKFKSFLSHALQFGDAIATGVKLFQVTRLQSLTRQIYMYRALR